MIILVPQISKLETLFVCKTTRRTFLRAGKPLSGIIVLTIMILPTVVNISITSLKAVPQEYGSVARNGSDQNADNLQGSDSGGKIRNHHGYRARHRAGARRSDGDYPRSGNVANMPALFNSVRFLTTGIVSEMSYASGLHREALFSIGLVLFIFIMVINVILNTLLKRRPRPMKSSAEKLSNDISLMKRSAALRMRRKIRHLCLRDPHGCDSVLPAGLYHGARASECELGISFYSALGAQ